MNKILSIPMLLGVAMPMVYAADEMEQTRKMYMNLLNQAKRKTPQEEYQERRAKHPMIRTSEEIYEALIQSEIKLYDKAAMETRIAEADRIFREEERHRCTEVMRYLSIPIERTFREDSQDQLAQFIIARIKQYETAADRWGFSVWYEWQQHSESTRSLWCRVNADPKAIMAAYDAQMVLDKQ